MRKHDISKTLGPRDDNEQFSFPVRTIITTFGLRRFHQQDTDLSKQCNTVQCDTMQYNTIQYNTIQYNTIHTTCSSLKREREYHYEITLTIPLYGWI